MTLREDEIDLRPYIVELIRRWWLIALVAVVVSLVSFLLLARRPQIYQSTATLVMTRSRTELTLAAQFPTVQEPTDLLARIQTAISILSSDSAAKAVLDTLGESLPAGYRSVSALKGSINIQSQGDLLLVQATASDPQSAALIANGYVEVGEQFVNRAYAEGKSLDELQEQSQMALDEYKASQQAFQDFVQTSELAVLKAQVREVENLVQGLAKDLNDQARYFSARQLAMEELAVEAQALKEQLAAGGDSSAARLGDALAVLRLHARSFEANLPSDLIVVEEGQTVAQQSAVAQPEPLTFDLQLPAVEGLPDPANEINDLDRFIALARQEALTAKEMLEKSQKDLLDSDSSTALSASTERLQALKARLEQQEARSRELLNQRDMDWEAYQVIAQKETEVRSGPQTQQVINIASPAQAPDGPAPQDTVRNALIAGLIAAILGSLGSLISTWWKLSRPTLQQPVQPPHAQTGD